MRILWLVFFIVLVVIAAAIIGLVMTINNGLWNMLGHLGVKPLNGFDPNMYSVWLMFLGVASSMVLILFAIIVARSIRERQEGTGW